MTLKRCKRCVMDGSAEEFQETENGCNFCDQAIQSLWEVKRDKWKRLSVLDDIKKQGKGKKYDVLVGLSGGVDSSIVLHEAVRMGLRPLCFSLDNGWNSKESDENVLKIVEKLEVPYYRYVLNKEQYRDLQMAFLKSGVKNIEIPTDHILMALSYELASLYDIKYILSGGNVATESIMPPSWGYNARDVVHIKDIFKRFSRGKIDKLPTCGLLKWNFYKWIKGIKIVYLLDYINYNRKESVSVLEKEYGYKHYGNKHDENVWTKWFQNFYLFEKFGIDKRKAHFSSMIISGQMTREEALEELAYCPVYPRIGIEETAMKFVKHSHYDYKTDEWLYNLISEIIRFIKRWRF